MSKFDIQVILDEMDEFTPEMGYDLVSVDSFALPGDKLGFIGHFETKEAAEKEQRNYPSSVIYTNEE